MKRASLSIIDYDSVSGYSTKYINVDTETALQIKIVIQSRFYMLIYKPAKLAHFKTKITYFNEMLLRNN